MRGEIRIVEDPAAEAAERLAEAAGGHIALSGGSTPRAAYERAAQMDVDWSGTTFWFGDDRCVPHDHEHSNYRMFKEAFLGRLKGDRPDVRPIMGEKGPHAAADDYERELRQEFGEQVPRLDLAVMGLGPDGHTASLFPDADALNEKGRLAVGVEEPGMEPYVPRVTLTLPVFNAARAIVWLVTGKEKADAAARAFADPPSPATPASLVEPSDGTMTVLLDREAGARLGAGA
jgi:6-phosphogluconolactonase